MSAIANIRGLSYPLRLINGGLATSTDLDLIKESIFSVLETIPSERVMQYTYGTPHLVFDAVRDFTIVLEIIRQALESQIPEVDRFDISGNLDEEGVGRVEIQWTVEDLPQVPIQYQLTI